MEAVALRGRLLPGAHDQYKQAHDEIPMELLAAQRAAGIRRWMIFTDAPDLFHYAECESFDEAMRRLAQDPVDARDLLY